MSETSFVYPHISIVAILAAAVAPNRFAGDASQWFYAPETGVESRQVATLNAIEERYDSRTKRSICCA